MKLIFNLLFVLVAFTATFASVRNRYERSMEVDVLCQALLTSQVIKDKWPVERDCHSFYHCSLDENSPVGAKGTLEQCDKGMFFNYEVQACIEEGPVPCQDLCYSHNDDDHFYGCFQVPNSCSTYFECVDRNMSVSRCCPDGTSFNANTCHCDIDMTCHDTCTAEYHDEHMMEFVHDNQDIYVAPMPSNVGSCVDSFGNKLTTDENDNRKFFFEDGHERVEMICSEGSFFHYDTCQCQHKAVEEMENIACLAYFPFDNDFSGHSMAKFYGHVRGRVSIDSLHKAHGSGSARFIGSDSKIIYDSFRDIDFENEASICFFYKCLESHNDPSRCLSEGSIIASSGDREQGNCFLDFVSHASNRFEGTLRYQSNEEALLRGPQFQLDENKGINGFHQVCVVAQHNMATLYVDNVCFPLCQFKIKDYIIALFLCRKIRHSLHHSNFLQNHY